MGASPVQSGWRCLYLRGSLSLGICRVCRLQKGVSVAHADGQMPSEMALLVGAEKGTLCLPCGEFVLGKVQCRGIVSAWLQPLHLLASYAGARWCWFIFACSWNKGCTSTPHLPQARIGCVWQVMAAFLMSSDSLSHGAGLPWAVPPEEQQCFQLRELAKTSLGCSDDKVTNSPLKCRKGV